MSVNKGFIDQLEADLSQQSSLLTSQANRAELTEVVRSLEKGKKIIYQLNLVRKELLEELKQQTEHFIKKKTKVAAFVEQLQEMINQLDEDYQIIIINQAHKKASELQLLRGNLEVQKKKISEQLWKAINKIKNLEIVQEEKKIENKIFKEQSIVQINQIEKQSETQMKQKGQNQESQNQSKRQLEQFDQLILQLTEDFNLYSEINQNEGIIIPNYSINECQEEILQIKMNLKIKTQEFSNMKQQIADVKNLNEKIKIIINELKANKLYVSQLIESLSKQINESDYKIFSQAQQKTENKQQQIDSLNNRPYENIHEYTKKQLEWCYAIAFNKEQTVMVAGCGKNTITVFEFQLGLLNQKQLLSDHTSDLNIFTLYFMTKHNQFISGTKFEIGIWSYNNTTKQWYCQQMLKQAHSDLVNRVIMSKNEDLLISCSDDRTIKFWIKKSEWECSQTLIYHTNCVHSICLNESCTQLVSCGQDNQIIICEQGENQKWRKIQRIIVQNWGERIFFVDVNLIIFQPYNGNEMKILKLDLQKRQFINSKDAIIQNDSRCWSWFPMQFNNNKQLLMNKNGYQINLFRKLNDEFILEQSIKFDTSFLWGAMTEDFQFLVTWDYQTKEYKVWKQK